MPYLKFLCWVVCCAVFGRIFVVFMSFVFVVLVVLREFLICLLLAVMCTLSCDYGVATDSIIDKIIGLFRRILALL